MFPELFSPGHIGSMELKNRIIMVPLMTNFADDQGYVTQRLIDYYVERARGGAGLIIIEAAAVQFPLGKGFPHQLAVSDDRFVEGLSRLTKAIRQHGARVALQLYHAGSVTSQKMAGAQPVGPSAIRVPRGELTRELSIPEIADTVLAFGNAARLARKAGFDGVEIVATGGYLVCEFLSRAWNKRQDEFGGTLENRARFLTEIIKAIRQSTSAEYPVWPRFILEEHGVEGGITLEETIETARLAEKAGAAAINTSIYGYGKYAGLLTPEITGELVPKIARVKQAVSIPVIAVGRLDAESGNRALREEKADFIALGRRLVADPELPIKAASGKLDDIAPCIACLHCLETSIFGNEGLHCSVNPATGNEREFAIAQAPIVKRVFVVGGGPAGMEAARVAALRGHEVTLFEKLDRLGGQLLPASVAPHKQPVNDLQAYLSLQLKKAGVKITLGKTLCADDLEKIRPDAVVLATGVSYRIPNIPGLAKADACLASDVLAGTAQVGQQVIVIGGELVGPEVAEFLAEQGKHVTIVEVADRIASKVMPVLRVQLLSRLADRGVVIIAGVAEEKISDHTLEITTRQGETQLIKFDTIVIATGAKSNRSLFESLDGRLPEVYMAGDCVEPRKIADAILDGATAGRKI